MIGKEKLHAILRQPNPALDQKPHVSSAKTTPAPKTFEQPLWYIPRGSRNAMSPAVPTMQPLALRSWCLCRRGSFPDEKTWENKIEHCLLGPYRWSVVAVCRWGRHRGKLFSRRPCAHRQ